MEEEALTTLIHQLIEKQKEKRRAEKALTKGKLGRYYIIFYSILFFMSEPVSKLILHYLSEYEKVGNITNYFVL